MARDVIVETRNDRRELARDAGFSRVSLGSVLAGTLGAYGAGAVLLAIAAAVVKAVGVDTNLSTNEWRQLGMGGGIAVAVVMFLAYLYGGYVAGRMSRRAGALNGVLVFVLGIAMAAGVAALANAFTDGDTVMRNLRNIGVPTSAEEWRDVGTVAGIGSLVAMLLGSIFGGTLGERWHGKLMARAWDPEVGDGVPVNPGARHTVGDNTVVDDGRSTVMSRRGDRDRDSDSDRDRDGDFDGRDRDRDRDGKVDLTDRTDSTLDDDYDRDRDGDRTSVGSRDTFDRDRDDIGVNRPTND